MSTQLLGPGGPWALLGPGPLRLVLFLGPAGGIPVVLASLAACSLAFSPGPRRGLAIVGWRRACLMIAGLSAGFGFPFIVQLVHPGAPAGDLAFRLLGVLPLGELYPVDAPTVSAKLLDGDIAYVQLPGDGADPRRSQWRFPRTARRSR